MKYMSKTHLVLLMIIVVILGGMLLLGERFSDRSIFEKIETPSKDTGTPFSVTGANNEESFIYGTGEPKSQIEMQMQSKSFVIRPGQVKLSYTDALSLYKNDLIQFDENCQVSKGNKSFVLNNEIMIDNRSSKPNTFSVGEASVVVGPYDFGFLILKEEGESIPVGCGERKNIINLLVQ